MLAACGLLAALWLAGPALRGRSASSAFELAVFQAPTVAPLELGYKLRLFRPNTHLIEVEIVARKVADPALDFVMPAWSPGRYAIYDFAKNVQEFQALGSSDQPLPWTEIDKQT
ncbi:MAG: hypothetical protein DMG24_01680, partial [Acidobacteria bacterium]